MCQQGIIMTLDKEGLLFFAYHWVLIVLTQEWRFEIFQLISIKCIQVSMLKAAHEGFWSETPASDHSSQGQTAASVGMTSSLDCIISFS